MAREWYIDCRSDPGITLGLIDGIIATCRVLVTRNLDHPAVRDALADLRDDEDLNHLLARARGESGQVLIERHFDPDIGEWVQLSGR